MENNNFNLYCMYYEIKRLREVERRSIQWIADHLKLNFRTVKKFLAMEPDAFHEYLKLNERRSCVLDPYRDFVESRLQLFPDTSSAQMLDWLKENYPNLPSVHPKTAYNFVMRIRQEYGIPKVPIFSRQYILLPFLRQFLFTDKLVSWDRPAGRSQETKRPSGIFPPAFYIPIPDGAFPYYNTSYTPLFCDINPNRYQTAQDRSSRT